MEKSEVKKVVDFIVEAKLTEYFLEDLDEQVGKLCYTGHWFDFNVEFNQKKLEGKRTKTILKEIINEVCDDSNYVYESDKVDLEHDEKCQEEYDTLKHNLNMVVLEYLHYYNTEEY